MESIDEVSNLGRNIPGLLHSVVIHVVQSRDQINLSPLDDKVVKITHFVPSRTRLYMIRASMPDLTKTISFEDDLEEIISLQRSCGNDVFLQHNQFFLHSVGIYATFCMEGLLLPITHPGVILASCFTPRLATLYTIDGDRTTFQHESRRLKHLIKRLISQFVEDPTIRIHNNLTNVGQSQMISIEGIQTQSNYVAFIVDNSVQDMYDVTFEPQSSVIQIIPVDEFDDNINVIDVSTIIKPQSEFLFFSDIMPSTLPINNFDLTMLIMDQIISDYANKVQPVLVIDTERQNIQLNVPYAYIKSVDVTPMLQHHQIPSNVLGISVDEQRESLLVNPPNTPSVNGEEKDCDDIILQSGSWTDYLPSTYFKKQVEKTSFVSQYTVFKIASWIVLAMVTFMYGSVVSKIYNFIKMQQFLYNTNRQYNQYKKAAMTSVDQIFEYYTNLTPNARLRLVEIKSILTAIYYIYSGQINVASSHLTTLFLTRPITLGTVLLNGGLLICHYIMTTKYCVFTCQGKKCVVSNDEFVRLCKISDSGKTITLDDINESIEVQAGEIEEVATNIGSLFAQWQISDMHVKDIELANKQFAYMRNVSHLSSDRVSLMIIILRLVLRTLWSYDPLDVDFQLFASDLVDHGNAIKNMVNNKNQICSDRKIMLDVIALHKTATGFMTHARMQSMPGCLQRYFALRYKEIDEMCTIAHQYLLGAQQRAEPVCVFIRGDPGSGKSLLTMFLMNALEEMDESEFSAEKCYTLSKDKYYEGYANQKYCNSDDVFQINNTETLQNEAERIIRMVNSTPYNLPMAFEAKGTTFFNSQFVFLSTNYGRGLKWENCTFEELKIADTGAIKRRLNLVLERNAKSCANVCDNEYYVAQCDTYPDYVGKKLKPGDIAQLVFKMRQVRLDRHAKSKCSRNDIRAAVGLPPLVDKEIEFYPKAESHTFVESATDYIHDLSQQIKQSYINLTTSQTQRNPAFLTENDERKYSDYIQTAGVINGIQITDEFNDQVVEFFSKSTERARYLNITDDEGRKYIDYLKGSTDLGNKRKIEDFILDERNFHGLSKRVWRNNSEQKPSSNMPGLIPLTNGLIQDDTDMTLQVGDIPIQQTRKPPTAVEWILKVLPIQLCEWMESPYCKWFIYGFTIIVTAILCQKLFVKLFPETVEEQSWKNKEAKAWGQKKNSRARKLNMHPSENFGYSTVPQVALHSSIPKEIITQSNLFDFHNCMTKTMSKGVALLEFYGKDNDRSYQEYGLAFHIKDGIMITPSHLMFKYTMDDVTAHILIHLDGKVYKMDIPENTWKIENEDVILFYLPKSIPKPVSLYKYLIRAEKPPSVHPLQEVYQLGIGFNNEILVRNYNRVPKSGTVNHIVDGEIIVYDLGFTYSGDCQKGHSGSPVIVITLEGPKLIGMHVGATTKTNLGIAYVLCQEWFDDITSGMITQSANLLPVKISHTVPPNEANNMPHFTRIRKSPIYSWNGPPGSIPAKFSPFENENGEIIDPLVVAMSKLKQEHFENPEDLHEEQVLEYMKNVYPPRDDARLMSYDEAINGVPERSIPSIVGSTSAGYPYCLSALKGKNPYIVQINNRYTYQDEFLKKVQLMEEKLREGEQISVIWADTLKDETRPIEKVMAGKTRLFTSCPLHYLVLVRRYFLDFVGRIQELAATHPVSVGINPHSLQWTLLYQRMAELNGSIIAGDFSNYDGSVPAFVGKIVLKFINLWYKSDDIDANVRALLFEHLWNGVRICGDKIYFTKDGNPSGNPLTSIFNSLVNMIMCYIILTQDFKLLEDEFRMAMYGDDNIISVSHVGLRVSDFTPHFKRRFNMSYTHFTKIVGNDPYDTMDTIRYLGRSFVKNMTVMRAPLQLDTILESTYWVRGKDHEHVAFISTIRAASLELSHYPMREYNKYVDQLYDAVRFAGLLPQYNYLVNHRRTWFDYHTAFYDEQRRNSLVTMELRALAYNLINVQSDFVKEDEEITIICQSGTNTVPSFHGETTESRHVEYTERAANEAPQTQGIQLGMIQDVAPMIEGHVGPEDYQDPMKTCNMELFQLDKTLDREYLLANVTWSVSAGVGTQLQANLFPQDLFAQFYISQKIEDFRFFRAGIRYSVRLTSTKLLYGSIMIIYIPEFDSNDILPTTMSEWSGYPHMILSASAGDTAVFDVPFIYNKRAVDLTDTITDEMGSFYVIVLNPLLDISGTVTTANLMIMAQFLGAELFLPHADISDSFEIHSGKGQEGRIKSEKGSLSSVYNITKSIGSALQAATLASSYSGGTVTMIKSAVSAAQMLGLSKPRTTDMTSVLKVNPYSDINTGTGLDLMPTLGMDPENQISTRPNVGGIGVDEMDFKQICGTPVLYSIHNLGPSTAQLKLCDIGFSTSGTFLGYTDWLANIFTYVSGSKKVKLYFMASQFHSARIVLYMSDSPTVTEWQNCYHRIVDVQGDTQVEFTLPYCDNSITTFSDGQNNAFSLYITVLSWSQPDASLNTPIYVNTYTSAADDFEFGGLLDEQFVAQSCPRNDFSGRFDPFHPSFTGYKQKGLVYGEKYTTLRQVIHRYSAITQGSLLPALYTVDHYSGMGDVATKSFIGLEMIGLLFHFWRGSKRVKFIPHDSGRQQSIIVKDQADRYLKGTGISCVPNPVAEVELPFYFNVLYLSTRSGTTQRAICGSTAHDTYALTAAGDDFSFHFIRPPPKGRFQNPANCGYVLLQIFLDS